MSLRRRIARGILRSLGAEDVLVLAAVVGLPWWWGGVGLDAYRTAAAVLAVAAGWALARRGAKGLGWDRRAAWLIPAVLLGAFAFTQSIPMPRSWVAAVSPRAAGVQASAFGEGFQSGEAWLRHIQAEARRRVPEAAAAAPVAPLALGPDAPSSPGRFTLSLLPSVTRERAFWYAALLLAFLLVTQRTTDRDRAAVYRGVMFVSFGVMAIVGILAYVTAPDRLLWIRAAAPGSRPFGPYVNPSHFGGVMELAVPWMLGYGLVSSQSRDPDAKRAYRYLALAGACLCAAAALLAASKMAAITIGLNATFLVLVAIAGRKGRARWALAAGAAAGVLLLSAIVLLGPLRGRVIDFLAVHTGDRSESVRGPAWGAALRMAADYPLAGSGFGAFRDVFPAYLAAGESEEWAQLHNDYLELYLAGGLIAAGLCAWLAAGFALRVGRAVRAAFAKRRGLSALGLAAGLVAMAVHEGVDFNLQIPANALLFVVLCAMSISPLSRSSEGP